MINAFYEFFNVSDSLVDNKDSFIDCFISSFGGTVLGDGLFTVIKKENQLKWNGIVESCFPRVAGKINVIAYDWLGRIFATLKDADYILMFSIGTASIVDIGCSLVDFLNVEIPQYSNDSLAYNFFKKWKTDCDDVITYGKCVGYKVPLFLGGKDAISNLELSDMEVYWVVLSQVLKSK